MPYIRIDTPCIGCGRTIVPGRQMRPREQRICVDCNTRTLEESLSNYQFQGRSLYQVSQRMYRQESNGWHILLIDQEGIGDSFPTDLGASPWYSVAMNRVDWVHATLRTAAAGLTPAATLDSLETALLSLRNQLEQILPVREYNFTEYNFTDPSVTFQVALYTDQGEVQAPGYERQLAFFQFTENGNGVTNTEGITWPTAHEDWGTITNVRLSDDVGSEIFTIEIERPLTILAGVALRFEPHSINVTGILGVPLTNRPIEGFRHVKPLGLPSRLTLWQQLEEDDDDDVLV